MARKKPKARKGPKKAKAKSKPKRQPPKKPRRKTKGKRTAIARRGALLAAAPSIDQILSIASRSPLVRFDWPGRGVAPLGFIKGMALTYARVYCKFKDGDPFAAEMAKANTEDADRDALAWYAPEFRAARMRNDVAAADTLRHLFVLMLGLGMRESSGRYCEGRDRSASNTTAETAEAGLFQTSFNARSASALLPRLFADYMANRAGFVETFREGVRCRASDFENFGTGRGAEFQQLSKECPAFATEFAAVGLRNFRKHWGPITRKEAQLRSEGDALLLAVQDVIDATPGLCAMVR